MATLLPPADSPKIITFFGSPILINNRRVRRDQTIKGKESKNAKIVFYLQRKQCSTEPIEVRGVDPGGHSSTFGSHVLTHQEPKIQRDPIGS